MAKGTKEPCRKLYPLKGMCPQTAPALREAEESPQGSELHQALLSQCPGERHRLSMSCPSVATVPRTQGEPQVQQPKPLPSDLIPSSVHDFSILQAHNRIRPSQRRANPSSSPVTPVMLQPSPRGSLGVHRISIPSGLWEQTAGLTPNTSCAHGHGSGTGAQRAALCPLQPLTVELSPPLTQLVFPLLPLRRC